MPSDKTSTHCKAHITADALVRGTAYAMEQAWHLLRDAVLLIQQERYASSLVIATFCLEQLGRAEIYRKNAKRASEGKRVTLSSMNRDLIDHAAKLYEAQIPVTAALVTAGELPAPGSPRGGATRAALARHSKNPREKCSGKGVAGPQASATC